MSALFGGRWWIRTTEVERQQIYSLPPLAAREISPIRGAGGRTRTPDLLITNQLLYQLSYTSLFFRTIYILTQGAFFVNNLFHFFVVFLHNRLEQSEPKEVPSPTQSPCRCPRISRSMLPRMRCSSAEACSISSVPKPV